MILVTGSTFPARELNGYCKRSQTAANKVQSKDVSGGSSASIKDISSVMSTLGKVCLCSLSRLQLHDFLLLTYFLTYDVQFGLFPCWFDFFSTNL